MGNQDRKISLGLTNEKFNPGVHICQIFNEDYERHDALLSFILSGIQSGEGTACFSDKETEKSISDFLIQHGISYGKIFKEGQFSITRASEIYFQDNEFEPGRLLNLLKKFYEKACEKKFSGGRIIGEMSPEVEKIQGGSKLLEYESKVSLFIQKCPLNAVCQYDARSFDGSTIMNILKVHPYMIVKGSVVHNPFYIPPEEFLSVK